MDLTKEAWQRATREEQAATAKRLAAQLPMGFTFDSLKAFHPGLFQDTLAVFDCGCDRFVFIPGGEATLGFDAERRWTPNPDEERSWQSTCDEYNIGKSIHEYVVDVTLRPRTVRVPPLLVECNARELGWETSSIDDPEVQELLRDYPEPWEAHYVRRPRSTRIGRDASGNYTVQRSISTDHAELSRALAAPGFRFPTSDEWEHVCAAGAYTLFHWGDHVPCDRGPTDISPAEAAWRWEWVESRGTLESPARPFEPDWDRHRQPNAWGLIIANDPYHYELVAETGTTRGGDGGSLTCGGAGYFMSWLVLATAYFEDNTCRHEDPILPGFVFGRRVLELT